jgi:hypothetical protein
MERLVDIDAHGRVIPGSDEARRALADRAGRFALLPSAADLLLALRTPASGEAASRPRCILAGDLAGFPAGDLVAFVHQARLSGVLTVAAGGTERRIVFAEGEVRSVESTAPREDIGEIAVRLGFASEAQVAQAAASGAPVGSALVDLGFVAANDLWRCLHEQVTAIFHAILLCPAGTFFLVDEDLSGRTATPLSMSAQSLLMDAIRRIDELSLFRARIPGPEAYVRRREPTRPLTLHAAEAAMLALVDGRRTVAEIATAAHVSEFDATKILYHLSEAGYVEALSDPLAGAAPADRLGAIVSGMNELLHAVATAVPAGARAAFLDAAHAFLADRQGRYAPVLAGISPGPDGTLDAAAFQGALASLDEAALARLVPSGDPARVAFDALREALFFWLFLAGDRITPEADEALAATVKRRLAQLEGMR